MTFLCLEDKQFTTTNFARRFFAVNEAYELYTLKTRGTAKTLTRPTLYFGDVFFIRPDEKWTHLHCALPGERKVRQWLMSVANFCPLLRCIAMLGTAPSDQVLARVSPVALRGIFPSEALASVNLAEESYEALESLLKNPNLTVVRFKVNLFGENKSGGSGKVGSASESHHLFISDHTTNSVRRNYAKKNFDVQVEEMPTRNFRERDYNRSADDLKSMIAKGDGCDIDWFDNHVLVEFEKVCPAAGVVTTRRDVKRKREDVVGELGSFL